MKKIVKFMILFGISGSSFLLSENVFADNSKAESKSSFRLLEKSTEVDPSLPNVILPNSPGSEMIKPDDDALGIVGSGDQSFYINWASDLVFNDVSTDQLIGPFFEGVSSPVILQKGKQEFAPFVQVTDNRIGGTGWSLKLEGSPFIKKGGSQDQDGIKGVSIVFQEKTLIPSSNQEERLRPQIQSFNEVQLNGEPLNMLVAEGDQGFNTWTLSFTDDESGLYTNDGGVIIRVPKSSKFDRFSTYESELIWTLSSNPL